MILSVALPSNRRNAAAIAGIAGLVSMASEDVEVAISDNSGDIAKRNAIFALPSVEQAIITIRPACTAYENVNGILGLVGGQFILFAGDDDQLIRSGLERFVSKLRDIVGDGSVSAVTGSIVNGGMQTIAEGIDGTESAAETLDIWLSRGRMFGQFYCSPVRQEIVRAHFDFLSEHPYDFSFQDVLLGARAIAMGRVLSLPNAYYVYDDKNWKTSTVAIRTEEAHYEASGLDPSTNILHWLLVALEGALMLRTLISPAFPAEACMRMCQVWVAHMHRLLSLTDRITFRKHSEAERTALAVRSKWLGKQTLDLAELLADVSDFLETSGSFKSRSYHDFWERAEKRVRVG